MKLALFDFDGTISHQDSLIHFIRYARGNMRFFLGALYLSPMLIRYFLGFLDSSSAKARIYQHFFYAWQKEKFEALCLRYAQEQLPRIIRPQALGKLKWHQAQGHEVVVVSASIENYLLPWCEQLSVKVLATQLAFSKQSDGAELFTGHFSSLNCYGIEKVRRINQYLNTQDYEFIYAYGDTKGDKEMLELAHESHFKPFH